LAKFQKSFTDILTGKVAIRQLLNISPHLKCVATVHLNFTPDAYGVKNRRQKMELIFGASF